MVKYIFKKHPYETGNFEMIVLEMFTLTVNNKNNLYQQDQLKNSWVQYIFRPPKNL